MRFFSALPFVALFAGAVFAAPSTGDAELVVRNKSYRSVPTICADLHTKLQAPCGQLSAITAKTATTATIKPICDNISGVVADAVAEIKLLKGQSASVILGLEGGALVTVEALSATLSALFSLVIVACGSVLAVAGTNFLACQLLLAVIAKAIADLHTTTFSICGLTGLQTSFFAGIHAVLPTCYSLNLFAFLNTFGLQLTASSIVGGVCSTLANLLPL